MDGPETRQTGSGPTPVRPGLERFVGLPNARQSAAQRALALDPQSTIVHFNLGVAQLKLGHLAEAARSFEWAGPLGEGNLAVTAALRGDLELAHRLIPT